MVAIAIAAVELFILLMVGFVVGAKAFSDKTQTATTAAIQREAPQAARSQASAKDQSTQEQKQPSGPLPRGKTSVVVLNGNGIPGAAATTADQVHTLHYLVTATGNAPSTDFTASVVMFRPGFKPAAKRLAEDLNVKRVTPLDGLTKGDLQGAQLALVIGG